MFKFLEKLRVPISYISLIVLIVISFILGIGESVDIGTFVIRGFASVIVYGVMLLLYILGVARKKAFPILVTVVAMLFIMMLEPFMNAFAFEIIGNAFNQNAALGLGEILYLIMVLGGLTVLVLYLLESIFGFRLSFLIGIFLIVLLGVSLTYFVLEFIGIIIALANNQGAVWYELFTPLIPVGGYLFIFVNFALLEEKTKNL